MDDRIEREPHDDTVVVRGFGVRGAPDLSAIPSFLRARAADDAAAADASTSLDWTSIEGVRAVLLPARPVISGAPDPGAIPMASISPRRLLHLVGIVALAWGVVSFSRQVATASATSAHADELRAANATLQVEVSAMQRELALIQERRYLDQEARAYRLGGPDEIPFALQGDLPSLDPDAPGSASVRLGAGAAPPSPLERWLDVLFGAGG